VDTILFERKHFPPLLSSIPFSIAVTKPLNPKPLNPKP